MTIQVVWLLDTSAMVGIKTAVPGKKQWQLFKRLERMVEAGEIGFPKQIRTEVAEMAHPDAPGVWADGVFHAIRYSTEPDMRWLQTVMSSDAARVVDPNKTREDGDPYLLAMALQLQHDGLDVCVVTEDYKDNPARISLTSACDHLAIKWCHLDTFLECVDLEAS